MTKKILSEHSPEDVWHRIGGWTWDSPLRLKADLLGGLERVA
ncbi:MAG TPA: hypothetical protein VMU80_02560 [Bryobacteraceae bacterium]|nr:hypothetical protein [Bryobacteraceae bacterium]